MGRRYNVSRDAENWIRRQRGIDDPDAVIRALKSGGTLRLPTPMQRKVITEVNQRAGR
jgi:hypothetical protein